MGSRASYVIRRNGQVRAYGSHWGASSLTDDLFWGPEYATRAFEAQSELDELADIEGGDEGCALIDWEQRHLLWSAANCELPLQRRLYSRLLAEMWPNWTVAPATRGTDDLLNYLGAPTKRLDDDSEADDEEEEEPEQFDLEDEQVVQPKRVTGSIADIGEIEPGNWLTVRDADGSLRDYFGFFDYGIDDLLCAGEPLAEQLRQFPSLDSPPSELVTNNGAIIDRRARVVWRWEGPRYEWQERAIRKAWAEWSFQDIAGEWQGQMQATGREPGALAGGDRQLLGVTVAELLTDSSVDPHTALHRMATLGHGLRVACIGATAAVGIVGGSLGLWLDSTAVIVLTVLLFSACLVASVWFWRRTSGALSVLRMVDAFPKDAPRPGGLTIDEKRQNLNRVLARLGYPSVEELERAGELPRRFESDDEDEDE